MPSRLKDDIGLVISRQPEGEKFLKYCFFSAENGLFYSLCRISNKSGGSYPDLFQVHQTVEEVKGNGGVTFLKEWRLERDFGGIARHYDAFTCACSWASLLRDNATHLEHFTELFQATQNALSAWQTGQFPEAVYFKALWLFARTEGLAVKEDWAAGLQPQARELAATVLKTPVGDQSREDRSAHQGLVLSLFNWLQSEADFQLSKATRAPFTKEQSKGLTAGDNL